MLALAIANCVVNVAAAGFIAWKFATPKPNWLLALDAAARIFEAAAPCVAGLASVAANSSDVIGAYNHVKRAEVGK